jgi:hypothetical protein
MIYYQNICGLTNKTREIVTTFYLKFPQIMGFVEHNLKYMQIQQISIENCNLGTSICRISPDKGGVCIFIYKSLKFIPVSINPLNTEFNPICHLLALLGAHHILHVSRIRVKEWCIYKDMQIYFVKCEF